MQLEQTNKQQCLAEEEIGFWPQFLDDGKQEKTNKFPANEKKLTNKSCDSTAICKILRSTIDPFHTIVEISESQFCISIPVGRDFKPENLDVMEKDRVVIVEIKTEQTSEDGSSQLSQVFTKKIALLDEVNVEEIKSRLTPQGFLTNLSKVAK
ncbi:unnamed protein product [Allacma fusca]|uniref:SHSP domain-containing protein n=1 Tax=Allacma fusca TaxID=39272 RepID=A0A8J2KWM9_9HEXA|nr:unnamed protein product [Allacma fusca]